MTEGANDPQGPPADLPAWRRQVFGVNDHLAQRYADLLTTVGITRGMIGPREAERIWERHIANSAAVQAAIRADATVTDLGSGAGLPGIPLAISRPDLQIVLLEPMQRRVEFLELCVADLHLPNVAIRHARAEDIHDHDSDYVVVRAVASLDRLIGWSWGMLSATGQLLALKGSSGPGELDELRQTMTLDAEVLTLDAPGHPVTVIRVTRPPQLTEHRSAQPTRHHRRQR